MQITERLGSWEIYYLQTVDSRVYCFRKNTQLRAAACPTLMNHGDGSDPEKSSILLHASAQVCVSQAPLGRVSLSAVLGEILGRRAHRLPSPGSVNWVILNDISIYHKQQALFINCCLIIGTLLEFKFLCLLKRKWKLNSNKIKGLVVIQYTE